MALVIIYVGVCEAYFDDIWSFLHSDINTATFDFAIDNNSSDNQIVSMDGSRQLNINFSIENTGSSDAFIRVNIIPVICDNEDSSLFYRLNSYELSQLNSSLWREGDDGYIYYKNVLEAGDTLSEQLVSEIGFDRKLEGTDIKLSIYVESVQSRNNAYIQAWGEGGTI